MKTNSVFKNFGNVPSVEVSKFNQKNQMPKKRISMRTVQDGVNLSLSIVLLALLLRRLTAGTGAFHRLQERVACRLHRLA